jgi:hypothetical protein
MMVTLNFIVFLFFCVSRFIIVKQAVLFVNNFKLLYTYFFSTKSFNDCMFYYLALSCMLTLTFLYPMVVPVWINRNEIN